MTFFQHKVVQSHRYLIMAKTIKQSIGNLGEYAAREYLHHQGYKILEENWRYKRAEVDLLVADQQLLVIVEVKRRQNNLHGYPEEAIDTKKLALLLDAGEAYQQLHPKYQEMRVDIVSITDSGPEAGIVHFQGL